MKLYSKWIYNTGRTIAYMSAAYNNTHYNLHIHGTWNATFETMKTTINNNAEYYINYNGRLCEDESKSIYYMLSAVLHDCICL